MPIKKPTISLLMILLAGGASAEVWRCPTAEGIKFSDKPCPAVGQPVETRRLQANVVEATRPQAANDTADAPALQPNDTNACPDEAELRNWATRASSNSFAPAEKAFLADELRRARQCRKGQGRYTAEDWRLSRAAQAAQGNLSGRADARGTAEAMHSAADPLEGDRIARRRLQEDSDRRLEESLRERRLASCKPGTVCPVTP